MEFISDNVDRSILKVILRKKITEHIPLTEADKIMFVGLGNEEMQADSFGVEVCSKINTEKSRKQLYNISPCVKGITGIDSKKVLDIFTREIKPDIVLFFDSLLTRRAECICSLLQITNTTPSPAIGAENNETMLKLDVAKYIYTIGLPTMFKLVNCDNMKYELMTTVNISKPVYEMSSLIAEVLNEMEL